VACWGWLAVVVSAAPIPGIFNTGVDNGRNLLPDGAVDPHYTLVASGDPNFPGPNAFTVLNNGSPLPSPWFPDGPISSWISVAANQSVGPIAGFYDYQLTFDLTGFTPGTAAIGGQFSTDNEMFDILINGNSTGINNGFTDLFQWGVWTPFTITGGFKPGINTLLFRTHYDGGPTGLRTEISGTVQAPDLEVGVQIDGHSRLVISPTQILWDHLFAARPGTAGGSYPTALNGYGWFPKWPPTPNGTPGLSEPVTDISVRFASNGVSLSQQAGRTAVTIVQQPSPDNAFTLVVDFDDSAPPGADQYAVTLRGVYFILLPRVSVYVSCISVVWPTETNRMYQLQYALSLPASWADLGPPIQGTGTNVVFDDPVLAQPRRFYRVVPIQ
jgi:hypothetical protein